MKTFKRYKAHTATIMVLAIVMFISILPVISAVEFDNVLDYQEDDLKVVFNNMFNLPFIGEELGTIELKSHNSVTEINKVSVGKDKAVMYYIFTNWELYLNGLGDVKFIDMNTGKEVEKDYYFAEQVLYEECTDFKNGTENTCETKERWDKLDTKDIPNKNIVIGLITDVNIGDYFDGVWTIAGKEVTKHAEWTYVDSFSLIPDSAAFYGIAYDDGYVYIGDDTNPDRIHKYWVNGTNTWNNITYPGIATQTQGIETNGTFIWIVNPATDIVYKVNMSGNTISNFSTAGEMAEPVSITSNETFIWIMDTSGVVYKYNMAGVYQSETWTAVGGHRGITTDGSYFWVGSIALDNVTKYYMNGTYTGDIFLTPELGGANMEICMDNDYFYVVTQENKSVFRYEINLLQYPNVTLHYPVNYTNQTSNSVTFNCTVWDTSNLTSVSLMLDGVVNETNSSGINNSVYTFTKTMAEGDAYWSCRGANNNSYTTTAEERLVSIDITNPEVEILAPSTTIGSHVLNTNISLNWSANDTYLDTCVYGYEGVNITVTCSDNTTSINITNSVNRTIYFWVNDTFGHINMTSISWNYNFIETGSEYSSSAYETDNETFKINVTTTQTITSFSAVLNYNGTIYAADSSCSSGNCQIDATIDIPLLNTGQTTENKTYFWQLTIFNSTGTSNINTSTNTQNISYVNMSNYLSPLEAVNFTIYKESDLTDLSVDISASFDYYLGDGSVTKTANYSGTSNTFSMYINQNESFITNPQIDLSLINYDSRRYDFLNEVYTNVTTNKSLYLSNSTFSSDIIVEVRDEGLTPMSGIRVNISRYYPEMGSWREVSSQITDNFGQFVEKLIQNDVKYKFQFWNSAGTLLKTSEDIRIICRATICVLPFVIETTTDEFEDFEDVSLFTSDLTYDNTTNLFTFSWNDQTGESITMRLEVQRYLLNSSTLVCNTTSTQSLSTLTCSVGDSVATYKAQAYRMISGEREIRISILNIKANDPYATYGVEGLLWIFLLGFTCLAVGAWNPSVGAILYGVVFIAMGILGIISMPLQVFFANTLIVCIFVWAMKT